MKRSEVKVYGSTFKPAVAYSRSSCCTAQSIFRGMLDDADQTTVWTCDDTLDKEIFPDQQKGNAVSLSIFRMQSYQNN